LDIVCPPDFQIRVNSRSFAAKLKWFWFWLCSLDGAGAAVAGGMALVNSGNVSPAFGVA
jgi:hypothetical protein